MSSSKLKESTNKLPESLITAASNSDLVPFVGSGVGLAVNADHFPSWERLLLEMANELKAQAKPDEGSAVERLVQIGKLYMAAELAHDYLGNSMGRVVQRAVGHRKLPSGSTMAVPDAIWNLRPRLIVTTNYDRILELANHYAIVRCNDDNELATIARDPTPQVPWIWHLHGHVHRTKTLVVSPKQYELLYGSTAAAAIDQEAAIHCLEGLFKDNRLLFIGFGLQDRFVMDTLKRVLTRFRGATDNHFALVKEGEADTHSLWREFRIQPLTYKEHGEPLVKLLHQIALNTFPEQGENAGKELYEPVKLNSYLMQVRDNARKLWRYYNFPIDATLIDIYIEPRARQIQIVEEEDSLQRELHQIEIRGDEEKDQKDAKQKLLDIASQRTSEIEVFDSIVKLLNKESRVLVTGDAGSGKTTLLQWLIYINSDGMLENKSRHEFALDYDPRIPIFVKLYELVEWLKLGKNKSKSWTVAAPHLVLLHFVREQFDTKEKLLGQFKQLKACLRNGRCIVLFDGLDEIEDKERQKTCRIITAFAEEFANNRFVVTARPLHRASLRGLVGFTKAPLQLFDDDEIESLVSRWSRVLKTRGQSVRSDLLITIESGGPKARFLRNPLYLSLALSSFLVSDDADPEAKGVPLDWIGLLEQCIEAFLRPCEAAIEDCAPPRIRKCIAHVARAMHEKAIYKANWDQLTGWVVDYFENHDPVTKGSKSKSIKKLAGKLVDAWMQQPTIIYYDGKYSFTHRAFQEYLAASNIIEREEDINELISRRNEDFWREVMIFAAHLLPRSEARRFVERIAMTSSGTAASRNLCLAADCIHDASLEIRTLKKLICDGLVQAIENENSAVRERIDCGNSLSLIGDPRIPTIPEVIIIPAGEFLMGSNRDDIELVLVKATETRLPESGSDKVVAEQARNVIRKLYMKEARQDLIHVGSFQIAKYPVTNSQYHEFIQKARYPAPSISQTWAEPYNWHNGMYPPGLASHPVVLISYKDACTYCRWLSAETGKRYRLPTEAEWEKAARGTHGRTYPWGNEWNPDYCNIRSSKLKKTVPVGIYPSNAVSPFGVADMIGNVWEWCSTIWGPDWNKSEFQYPYDSKDGREDAFRVDARRIVRGGSWSTDQSRARCAYRTIDVPGTRNLLSVGFRVAMDIDDVK